MITIVCLLVYEFMQYNLTTFDDYIEDKWNKFDVAHIAMYGCCYFWLRMTRPEDSIINFFQFEDKIAIQDDNYARAYAIKMILVLTNILLIVLVVLKMLNYFRVFEGFGLFILLIGQCLSDLALFFIFMFLWLYVFTVMLYILNTTVPNPEDYPHCGHMLMIGL